jgi:hypothetical protein
LDAGEYNGSHALDRWRDHRAQQIVERSRAGFLGAYAFRAKASRENIGAIDTCNHDFRFLAIGSPV